MQYCGYICGDDGNDNDDDDDPGFYPSISRGFLFKVYVVVVVELKDYTTECQELFTCQIYEYDEWRRDSRGVLVVGTASEKDS